MTNACLEPDGCDKEYPQLVFLCTSLMLVEWIFPYVVMNMSVILIWAGVVALWAVLSSDGTNCFSFLRWKINTINIVWIFSLSIENYQAASPVVSSTIQARLRTMVKGEQHISTYMPRLSHSLRHISSVAYYSSNGNVPEVEWYEVVMPLGISHHSRGPTNCCRMGSNSHVHQI